MNDLIERLPDLPEWSPADWAAAGTVATAIVALVAAWVGFRQVREARTLREEQAQPFIVVDFEPSRAWRNAINLVIENTGKTLAKNVKVTFEPSLESAEKHPGYDIGQVHVTHRGHPFNAPRQANSLTVRPLPRSERQRTPDDA